MKSQTKTLTALAFAALLISAGGIAFAAPGSIDGSQTDTTTEVYISDGKTMDASFNASGDTTWNMTIQSVPDSADLAMNVSKDGSTYHSYSDTFGTYSDGDPDADTTTNGRYHAFKDSELADVPMTTNENVTLNVTYWNVSADTKNPTTIQVHVENSDERAVREVDTETLNSSGWAETSTEEHKVRRWKADENHVKVDDTVDVNGSNTTVIYSLRGADATDPFDNATETFSSDGAWTLMIASADGDDTEHVPVFYDSAPSDYNISDAGSYAVYDPDTDMVEYHLSSENFDGRSQADLELNTDQYSTFDLWKVYDRFGSDAVQDVLTAAV